MNIAVQLWEMGKALKEVVLKRCGWVKVEGEAEGVRTEVEEGGEPKVADAEEVGTEL